LLQTKDVVGRKEEIALLVDWLAKDTLAAKDVRILSVVAIGGMGKSALTWKWFQDIAPKHFDGLAGRMWWSFYESDAHWENFIIRALAYTAAMSEDDVRRLAPSARSERLLSVLDERPFLLVLDGFERMLLAYARLDAAHLSDEDLDELTAHTQLHSAATAWYAQGGHAEKHRLRQCADLRAADFLAKLATVRSSRVLISTRLYPAELQGSTSRCLPGCDVLQLRGLSDPDALELWREFVPGARSGSADQLLPLFQSFDNYPLLLRALAGEVAQYRSAPGDFDRWRRDHPQFDPHELPLASARTHVLEYALRGLTNRPQHVLHCIAAFRMPASWDTLKAVLIGDADQPCRDERALDAALSALEDRGLVGWDKAANRYDLHPIVRSVVWGRVGDERRRQIYEALHSHFRTMPVRQWKQIDRLEDLTPAVELYGTLIGLERYDEAYTVWRERLDLATIWRLNLSRERSQMVALLFPDGTHTLPRLSRAIDQSYALNALATAYDGLGRPGASLSLYQLAAQIDARENNAVGHCEGLTDLASACLVAGQLRCGEATLLEALTVARSAQDQVRECWILSRLCSFSYTRGLYVEAQTILRRAANLSRAANTEEDRGYFDGMSSALLAELALMLGDCTQARELAERAWEKASVQRLEGDFVRAARLQGCAALAHAGSAELEVAHDRLHHGLSRARAINLVQEELAILAALAELCRLRGEPDAARLRLNEIWTAAAVGPYPIVEANARIVLARVERGLGNAKAASEAAQTAFRIAWCDGPPFTYQHGLAEARKCLANLGVSEPPIDQSRTSDASTSIEANPRDAFWADSDAPLLIHSQQNPATAGSS
jgi:tetratricopeptide (TPR) repeat protein